MSMCQLRLQFLLRGHKTILRETLEDQEEITATEISQVSEEENRSQRL